MHDARQMPMTQRLLSQYLMLGLAGFFVFLMVSLTLTWRGQFIQYAALATVVPLLILAIGTIALRQTVRLNAQIEDQLRKLATAPDADASPLKPIAEADLTAVGWNSMLERISCRNSMERLSLRLNESMGGVNGRKLDQILNSLPDGIAVTDDAGRIVSQNTALAAFKKGDAGDDARKQQIAEFLDLGSMHDADVLQEKLLQMRRPVVHEANCGPEIADGVLRIARFPLSNGEDASATHVWVIRDITQQKLAEDMRTKFIFTATHELRTPLTNIKAYAETLSMYDDIDVEEQKQFYNTISAEATRLSRFVDELLNVSQMEAGCMSLACHETDVMRLVEEVVQYMQPEIDHKQIEFEHQLPPKLPKLKLDKDKMSACLVNLLGNAVKYTPEGGRVCLKVEVMQREIAFHVEDSGIGISEEELSKVFQKFFRSDDDRVRELNGSGLGLAFTQEVARLHGGRMGVQSELNKGSRFTLTLPVAEMVSDDRRKLQTAQTVGA